MAQNDGRGNLEISNMQLLFIRILFLAQMEAFVKWAQYFSFEVPLLVNKHTCTSGQRTDMGMGQWR